LELGSEMYGYHTLGSNHTSNTFRKLKSESQVLMNSWYGEGMKNIYKLALLTPEPCLQHWTTGLPHWNSKLVY